MPIFSAAHQPIVQRIADKVEDALLEQISELLLHLQTTLPIKTAAQGVSFKELANELWYILFGSINEELVRRKAVADPPPRDGEGRYLQSIQLFG